MSTFTPVDSDSSGKVRYPGAVHKHGSVWIAVYERVEDGHVPKVYAREASRLLGTWGPETLLSDAGSEQAFDPFVTELPDGTVIAGWHTNQGSTSYYVTRTGANNWTSPTQLINPPTGQTERELTAGRFLSTTWLCTNFTTTGYPYDAAVRKLTNGPTVGSKKTVRATAVSVGTAGKNQRINMAETGAPNGLIVVWNEDIDVDALGNPSLNRSIRGSISTDNGVTWSTPFTVARFPGHDLWNPFVILVKPGDLRCYFAQYGHSPGLGMAQSTNEGAHWGTRRDVPGAPEGANYGRIVIDIDGDDLVMFTNAQRQTFLGTYSLETLVVPAPTISSFTPVSGPVGTTVTITGTNLTGATTVKFHGTAALFTVVNSTTITATVPASATTGTLSVTAPGGTGTSGSSFTVTVTPPPAPTVVSFDPASGPVGTRVEITGTDLTGATAVTFNGVASDYTVQSSTLIVAYVPAGAGTGAVAVTTPSGTGTSGSSFTVTAPAPPTVTSLSPSSGPVGTTVTIGGTLFTTVNSVAFNGMAALFTLLDDSTITATVPTGATTGPVSVTSPDGTGTSGSSFTVNVAPPPAPTIDGFTPASGPVDTRVTITGTDLSGATAVTFHGTGADFSVTDSTHISAVVPAGADTGSIAVTTPGGTATSSADFTVVPNPNPGPSPDHGKVTGSGGRSLVLAQRGFDWHIKSAEPVARAVENTLKLILAAFQGNVLGVEDWSAVVANQQLMPLSFTDSDVPAGASDRQMRRVVSSGGGSSVAAKQLGAVLPFDAGLAGIALASDAALGAGSATFQLFANDAPAGEATLSWKDGDSASTTLVPQLFVIGANTRLDVRLDTSASFDATGASLVVDLYFVRF